nr:DegT/DnrJ/EryC1/StrS family aminotransferase [Treponema sp.]
LLPFVPEYCQHNAHMFYLLTKNLEERTALISYLKEKEVSAVFHYIPLHSAPAGQKFGRFDGKDEITTKYSERLIRLPLYYGLKNEDLQKVIDSVIQFYS